MKHPQLEQWSDYVRGTLEPEAASISVRHLDAGCRRCERRVAALKAVHRLAENLHAFEPPEAALRAVKNLFRIQQLVEEDPKPCCSLDLSFDSFLTPAPIGVRGCAFPDRHLVFKNPDLLLEVQVEAGEPLRLQGQLLDRDSNPIANVPTFLLDGGRIHSQDLSGAMGGFTLHGDTKGSPRLCLLLEEDLIEAELPSLATSRRSQSAP